MTADVKDGSAANVTSAVERLAGTSGVEVALTGYANLSMFEIDLFKEYGLPYISAGPLPSVAAIISQAPDDYEAPVGQYAPFAMVRCRNVAAAADFIWMNDRNRFRLQSYSGRQQMVD